MRNKRPLKVKQFQLETENNYEYLDKFKEDDLKNA